MTGGLADDGKRFYSDGRCPSNCSSLIGGGLGEDGAPADRAQRLADDGKRFLAWDRCIANCSFKIGGGLGEDGAGSDRAQHLADLYFAVFFVLFLASF